MKTHRLSNINPTENCGLSPLSLNSPIFGWQISLFLPLATSWYGFHRLRSSIHDLHFLLFPPICISLRPLFISWKNMALVWQQLMTCSINSFCYLLLLLQICWKDKLTHHQYNRVCSNCRNPNPTPLYLLITLPIQFID